MGQVTIEGSTVTPSDALGRGERVTVEVTDRIRQLVKIGAVVVIDGSLEDEERSPDAGHPQGESAPRGSQVKPAADAPQSPAAPSTAPRPGPVAPPTPSSVS